MVVLFRDSEKRTYTVKRTKLLPDNLKRALAYT